jgi:hypothetical protein
MKKTNIRINNFYIIEDGKEYFLSDIKDIKEFKKLEDDDDDILKKHKMDDITNKLFSLMEEHEIYSSVNFIVPDDKKKIDIPQKGG